MVDVSNVRKYNSPDYNYMFDMGTGLFLRWGKTPNDDPKYSPIGPEIADIEISTICNGLTTPCQFCYKSNTGKGKNMSLDLFKQVFSNMPKSILQIAFGIGDIDANPDLYKIMQYCRDNGVVPNVTINGARLTSYHVEMLTSLCGAVAVSRYDDKNYCYNAVQQLTNHGLKQVNIHHLLAEETFDNLMETLQDIKKDGRLNNLNAIVFLSLKQKGRGKQLTPLSMEKFTKAVKFALDNGISFGMDSCSASKFIRCVKNELKMDANKFIKMVEPCESYLFSIYVNVDGIAYPCSFLEGDKPGVDLKSDTDVWNHKDVKSIREEIMNKIDMNGCRECIEYII